MDSHSPIILSWIHHHQVKEIPSVHWVNDWSPPSHWRIGGLGFLTRWILVPYWLVWSLVGGHNHLSSSPTFLAQHIKRWLSMDPSPSTTLPHCRWYTLSLRHRYGIMSIHYSSWSWVYFEWLPLWSMWKSSIMASHHPKGSLGWLFLAHNFQRLYKYSQKMPSMSIFFKKDVHTSCSTSPHSFHQPLC